MSKFEVMANNQFRNSMRDLNQLQSSFDRLFNDMLSLKENNGMQELTLTPNCEVSETDTTYTFNFDLPGMNKDQVKVEVENNQLTISAERKEEKEVKNKKKYLSEVHYGSYLRSFSLPQAVDEKNVNAKFNNGVLTITIPKTESTKAKKIAIQ